MTRAEAKRQGLPPGYAVRLDETSGVTIYLADFRRSKYVTTEYPSQAEYFRRLVDADEIARRVTHLMGQSWTVTTVPADNSGEVWNGLHLDALAEAYDTVFGPEDDGEGEPESARTEWGTIHLRFDGRN